MLGNKIAAEKCASQQRLDKSTKQRPRYSNPTKAVHLNDKSARQAIQKMQLQFMRTSRAVTPEPDINTDGWAEVSTMLVVKENTIMPQRISGPTKDRNLVSAAAKEVIPTNVNVFVGKGGESEAGEIVDFMLSSGKYDHLVRRRMEVLECMSMSAPRNLHVNIYNSEDIPQLHREMKAKRAKAEKSRSRSDVAADPMIGATNESFSLDELRQIASEP